MDQVDSGMESVFAVLNSEAMDVEEAETEPSEYNVLLLWLAAKKQKLYKNDSSRSGLHPSMHSLGRSLLLSIMRVTGPMSSCVLQT
jgi:hypothetical protein